MEHSPFTPILKKDYHLSYPHVFPVKKNDTIIWYLVPESHENNTIDVYRAEQFPHKWTFETTLMNNINASDSTIFFYENIWWLFTSIGTTLADKNSNLSLFYSENFPSNSWKAHPLNPISNDSSNSRMAGSIILENGKLYRPAQNCKHNYGEKIIINSVNSFDTLSYTESPVKTLNPEKNLKAVCTHTINYSSSFIVRDIKTRHLRSFL
jgi:hypothetical protein